MKTLNIVFICTANICRSPMAEGILKKRWSEFVGSSNTPSIGINVTSMGIYGLENQPSSEYSVQICMEKNIDISTHKSRPLIFDELASADIIFTMERVQRKHLHLLMPPFREKIHLLGAWPEKETFKSNIKDPIGRRFRVYKNVCNKISLHVDRIIPHLNALASKTL